MGPPSNQHGLVSTTRFSGFTHGGFNSIRETLRLGVPMVVSPITGDQPHNARRCAELGVAVTVPPSETSSDVLAAAFQKWSS
jgi:UDP:flavonoid glycosyltransferase YjiC (YdhE family)